MTALARNAAKSIQIFGRREIHIQTMQCVSFALLYARQAAMHQAMFWHACKQSRLHLQISHTTMLKVKYATNTVIQKMVLWNALSRQRQHEQKLTGLLKHAREMLAVNIRAKQTVLLSLERILIVYGVRKALAMMLAAGQKTILKYILTTAHATEAL
jgi:hypothetical protein